MAENVWRNIMNSSPDGILAVQGEADNYRIVALNQEFCRLFALPVSLADRQVIAAEIAAAGLQELISSVIYQQASTVAGRQITLAEGCRVEVIVRPLLVAGETGGRVAYFRDLTSKLAAEDILRQQNGQLQALNAQLSEGIAIRNRLEEQLLEELELAGKVQRAFLPKPENGELCKAEYVYSPYHGVSGDILGLNWNDAHTRLFGFVIDICGHGVDTALHSTVLLMLTRQLAEMDISLGKKVSQLNLEAGRWFSEGKFAAGIFFEMNFETSMMTYVPAGSGYLLAASHFLQGILPAPGFLLGIFPEAEYEEFSVELHSGDSFYFTSDGISDLLRDNRWKEQWSTDFATNVNLLRQLAASEQRQDDASALCVQVGETEVINRCLAGIYQKQIPEWLDRR